MFAEEGSRRKHFPIESVVTIQLGITARERFVKESICCVHIDVFSACVCFISDMIAYVRTIESCSLISPLR